ncbi:SAF domain-containing protein [Paenibacillus sp. NPDC056579]|uniref:SAF domain-containing protein n=1 Tax=Paenibacillus sp. NPDC056579 TaxID=3345871 RepID=UPI0036776773
MKITKGKNNRFSKITTFLLPITGFLLMAALAGTVVFWEFTGREMVLYQEVIVPKEDLKRGTEITSEKLTTLKVEKGKTIEGAIVNMNDIIGLEAKQTIPARSQLSAIFFERGDLLTDENHFNFKIPNDWIVSAPNTLRRKDKVIVYEVSADALSKSVENKKIQIDATRTVSNDGNKEDSNITIGLKPDITPPASVDAKKLLQTTVTFVRDSANREVITTGSHDRLDASAALKDVEANLTIEDVNTLENAIKRGSKLMIGYSEGLDGVQNEVKSNR